MQNYLTVYVDASAVFHLSSGATDGLFGADWRSHAAKWWETQRPHFELHTSAVALEEAGRGEPEDAARQLEALEGIPHLEITDEVIALADELIRREAIPPEERTAATHIAVAAVHKIWYLMTWRIRRIAYPETGPLFRNVCEQQGYQSPVLCNPYELELGPMLPDEMWEELWEVKSQLNDEYEADPEKFWAELQNEWTPGFTYGIPGRVFKTREERDAYIESKRIPRD
ncbi:MAG: type II toxin-antitoxin system VapC family toxin [Chloroflexota bacterium]|nr:type II toxin-antitoxin system VapC family toxin [Chloroflexota bacterium]